MNLYLIDHKLPAKLPKAMRFNLTMGTGDMVVIISNQLSARSITPVDSVQYGGLSFVNTIPQIENISGINIFLKHLYEFKEYNECIIPEDMMIFAVPAHEVTSDITSLFNG